MSVYLIRFECIKPRKSSVVLIIDFVFQELHNKELELSRVQQEQRLQEELLQIKKKELDAREMVLLELELRIIMSPPPEPHKRKGKFSKTRLKVSLANSWLDSSAHIH